MPVSVSLNFNGNCREAMEFYAEAFETEPRDVLSFEDMMMGSAFELLEDAKRMIMQANMKIMGSTVMFADVMPGADISMGNNVNLSITAASIYEVQYCFNKLKFGGTVIMDLKNTFGNEFYGFLIDKFGIGWMFSYESEGF